MQTLMGDLTVELEDRPGTLAKATEAIAKAGINIEGAAGFPCGNAGVFHVLTKDAKATRKALESAGFKITGERQVLAVDVEDKPGIAAKIFRKIADAGINVDLVYEATNNRLVVGGDNVQRIKEILEREPAAASRM